MPATGRSGTLTSTYVAPVWSLASARAGDRELQPDVGGIAEPQLESRAQAGYADSPWASETVEMCAGNRAARPSVRASVPPAAGARNAPTATAAFVGTQTRAGRDTCRSRRA